jgi:hypothetical protein
MSATFQPRVRWTVVSTCQRWMMMGLLAVGNAMAGETATIPVRTVDGNLDAHARLQTIHAAMRRECGASPGSARCQRLRRDFQQQAKHCKKQPRR